MLCSHQPVYLPQGSTAAQPLEAHTDVSRARISHQQHEGGWLQAEVAILDEIDSGLDIDALREVSSAVNGLKSQQNATILVTHYKVRSEIGSAAFACLPACVVCGTAVWCKAVGTAAKRDVCWLCRLLIAPSLTSTHK